MPQDAPTSRARILRFPVDTSNAVDELNLCEFPLAVLSDRVPRNRLELSFTDTVWDESQQLRVPRRLKVSAPPAYGLPTAKDEEILLALIYLTDIVNQFQSSTVYFTRYQLIQVLGWDQGGKSYRRITDSLARWKSVTLDYHNAWRDHKARRWVSEIFSIIDNVTIYGKDDHPPPDSQQDELPLSSFKWNDVFFESMRAKYSKQLDFGFFQQLSTPTARRLFRFLDKRFGTGQRHWDFELRDLAFQNVGMSRSYDIGKIKEKLGPAIQELEQKGFLKPSPREKRFQKHGKEWRAYFARADQSCPSPDSEHAEAVEQLTSRGISRKVASELAGEFDAARIEKHLDIFDWTIEHQPEQLTNPAGFLTAAIRSDFAPPPRYQTREQREKAVELKRVRAEHEAAHQRQQKEQEAQRQQERAHIKAIRARLSPDELRAFEEQAAREADAVAQKCLKDPSTRSSMLMILVDKLLLASFPMEVTAVREATESKH